MIAQIKVFGEIGFDVTVKGIRDELMAVDKLEGVHMDIYSMGGDLFEGVAIYNYLSNLDVPVTANVLSVAASAAGIVMLAADKVTFGDGSYFMAHKPWTVSIGNSDDLDDAKKLLISIELQMAEIYAERLGITVEQAIDMMEEESWIPGDEFVERFPNCQFVVAVSGDRVEMMAVDVVMAYKSIPQEILASMVGKYMAQVAQKKSNHKGVTMQDIDLNAKIADLEKAVMAKVDAAIDNINAARAKIEVVGDRTDSEGRVVIGGQVVKTMGDYLYAAWKQPKAVKALVSRDSDATDGFPVPRIYTDELYYDVLSQFPMLRSATRLGGTLDSVSVPVLKQGADFDGGFNPLFKAEGADLGTAAAKIDEVVLIPHKAGTIVPLSGRVMQASAGIQGVIARAVSDFVYALLEKATYNGTGTGEPVGIIGSTGSIEITRDAANDIKAVDLVNMLAAFTTSGRSRAMWLASMDAQKKIFNLLDNSKGQAVLNNGQVFIHGIPVVFVPSVALGAKGDLMLIDPAAYYIHEGNRLEVAVTDNFDSGGLKLRVMQWFDGKPGLKAPILWATGKTASPFVVLN